MELKRIGFLLAFLCACITFAGGGRCLAQQEFAAGVVNGIEVYRNDNPRSRIFGNSDFLTSPRLCSEWGQAKELLAKEPRAKERLAKELISLSARINPSLPSGVTIVRQSVTPSPNCTATATYAAGGIALNVKLPGNVLTFNLTTPGPLPQSVDPRVSVRFDATVSARIEIPARARDGLSLSPIRVFISNAEPYGENITGDIALAATRIVGKITGEDFLGRLSAVRVFEFDDVIRFMVPINSELAAQLPSVQHIYDPTKKVLILRGPDRNPSAEFASFRSSSDPARFIRHRNSLGFIEPIRNSLGKMDATFKIVPGLAGRCVSLESYNYPNHFLRHQNSRLKLSQRSDDQLFREDATFCIVRGLAESGVSFQAANYQDSYIRHRNFELWLDRFDGTDLFKKDATFEKTFGLVSPPGPVR